MNLNFENKLDDIYILLEVHKPDIVSIQEANYDIHSKLKIRGYSVEYDTLTINYNIACTILLIREGINNKRKSNCEENYISSIWVEIFIKNRSILLGSYYRQWSLPSKLSIENSNRVKNQISRYTKYCNQVNKVCKEGKNTIILTDDNINSIDDHSNTNFNKNLDLKCLRD